MLKEKKIIISLKSKSKKALVLYGFFLKICFKRLNFDVSQINFPKKTKKLSLLKSPHVNKRFKEHFIQTNFKTNFYLKEKVSQTNLKYFLLNKPKSILFKFTF